MDFLKGVVPVGGLEKAIVQVFYQYFY